MAATARSSPLLIAAAWTIVILPTAWGLNYTVQNALKIFAKPTVAHTAPANSTADLFGPGTAMASVFRR